MSRVPIRWRLTAGFVAAMALVLGGTGFYVFSQVRSDLNATIDADLGARLDGTRGLLAAAGADLEPTATRLRRKGGSFLQIVSESGRVVTVTPATRAPALLSASQLAAARRGEIRFESAHVPGVTGRARVLAAPVRTEEHRDVVVASDSLARRDATLASLRRLLLTGGPIALILAGLLAYGVAAGALRPVEAMRRRAAAVSEHDPGNRLPVPPARDELAALGTTLNAMLDRLGRALERERVFAVDAAHELRTPITVLSAAIELALSRPRTAGELRDTLESVGEEGQRLVGLADDLLTLARVDGDGDAPQIEAIPVRPLLESVAAEYPLAAVDAPRELAALGDPSAAQRALANLARNALVHGGGPVSFTAVRRGDSVELHVLDAGPGVPPELIGHEFERFRRATDARSRPGTGLGLAIVDALAREGGGRAGLANRRTGGADAWLSLPAAPG